MAQNNANHVPSLRDECKTVMVPTFMKDFKCIGPECENHCCQKWNVSITAVTYQQLHSLGDIEINDVLANHTRPSIANTAAKSAYNQAQYKDFVMDKDGNCPFLTDEQLCYIHKNHGEQYLPMICNIYPRDTKLVDGTVYQSLSISCPEAARKILLDPSAMSIKEKPVKRSTKMPNFAVKMKVENAALHEKFKQLLYQCVVGSQTDSLEQRLFKMAVVFDVVSHRLKNQKDIDTPLYRLEHSLLSGELNDMYEQTPVSSSIQTSVLQLLLFEKRFVQTNHVFMGYKHDALRKLKHTNAYDEQTDKLDLSNFHHNLCEAGYQRLIDSHGHAFLNMLLHWIYTRVFNLHNEQLDLYKDFAHLALKFFLVRTLSGILSEPDADEKANGELLVGVIHSISRSSDHDHHLISDIYDKLCQDHLGQHEHILGLIKI